MLCFSFLVCMIVQMYPGMHQTNFSLSVSHARAGATDHVVEIQSGILDLALFETCSGSGVAAGCGVGLQRTLERDLNEGL